MNDSAAPDNIRARLQRHRQEHVLQFWDRLDSAQRELLIAELESIDLDQLQQLVDSVQAESDIEQLASSADSPPAVRADGSGAGWSLEDAKRSGEDALRAGHVGALIVAGGQGTRLGFNQPKGMFPIGPVSGRTLFEVFADRIAATSRRYGVAIPLYVMTSDATDADTREYFEQTEYLGLPREDVTIFKQGTMPAVDRETGRLLLSRKHQLALSPDGHGGMVAALDRNGCLENMRSRGVRHLSYIQVDNPLAWLCDPVLIGHHLRAGSEMTTQVVRKRHPLERVGNVVSVDGTLRIIEYSDLPESAAHATTESGDLRLWAGNIAVHMIEVEFLRRVLNTAAGLPFHRATKRVGYVDSEGNQVEPHEPNATKFERFIFDLLPLAENAFVVESNPSDAFAPVKNAHGAETDTPELARKALSDLHRAWLLQSGAEIAAGVQVEISPFYALNAEELGEKISSKIRIDTDQYFAT